MVKKSSKTGKKPVNGGENYILIADKEIERTRKEVEKIEKNLQMIQGKMRLLL